MLWVRGFDTPFSEFNPWANLLRLEDEMNRVLSGFTFPSVSEFPPVNIWGNEHEAVVTAEIPGIDPKDIEISITGRTLVLSGNREPETIKEDETFHRKERWYGKFTKSIELPFSVDSEKVEAKFSKGILTIKLPRAEADKPKKITVKSA